MNISDYLQQRIDAGDFPSAAYLVAEKGEIVIHDAVGHSVIEPERIKAEKETIYDLASLTKVLVTALLAAQLIDMGSIDLDTKIEPFLVADLRKSDKAGLTIRQLATHTSGLPAWVPLYLKADSRDRVPKVIAAVPFREEHAEEVVYSDLNFILLGQLVSERIDLEAVHRIFDPLGLSSTAFNPLGRFNRRRIAGSEKGNGFERSTCIEQGYLSPPAAKASSLTHGRDEDPFRSDVIWGEVHDGNAYFMGGVAGHAGLFSNAREVFTLARQFLPGSTTLLSPETCELFRTNFTPGLSEHRSFGFQLASTPDSTAGLKMSPESFGHLGFTGTSLWVDPVKERIFILLTNRTHHHDLPFVNINSVRRRFHDLAIDFLDKIR